MPEGRFHSFLARVPLPVAILDNQYRFVEVNSSMAELDGMPAEMHPERAFGELFPDLAPVVNPILAQVIETGRSIQVEMAIGGSQGQAAGGHWLVSWIPIIEHTEILMLCVEITEHKRAQEALKQVRAKLSAKEAELEQIAMLDEMGQRLHAAIAGSEALQIITSFVSRFFPNSSGAICLTDSVKSLVEVAASWGNEPVCESVFGPDDCWALREGRTYHVIDPGCGINCAHALDGESARLCIPMAAQMQTLGVLHLRKAEEGPFTEAELVLANKITEEATVALANLKSREVLRYQAVRDPLTDLYNRRYLQDTLNRELRRAVRKKLPLGIVMIDVDHFKRFNDSVGHDGGDFILRSLSATIAAHVRSEDVACRFGGDEFSLILPEASLEDLTRRAEQLCQVIRKFTISWRGRPLSGITASIGVAVFPDNGSTVDELMKSADDALYSAKAEGRDRVKAAVPRHSYYKQLLDQALYGREDFFAAEAAGNMLATFSKFALHISSSGFSNAVLELIPGGSASAPPSQIAHEIAGQLTLNCAGPEHDLLRKSLQETILQSAGMGHGLDSVPAASGIEEFIARHGVVALLERFLTLYMFDVLCFKLGDFFRDRVRNERSTKALLLRVERLCRKVVRMTSQDLRLGIALNQLSSDTAFSQRVIRTIEYALRREGSPSRGLSAVVGF
jgi:diguanylate cyclase (GGDEF)-like protein